MCFFDGLFGRRGSHFRNALSGTSFFPVIEEDEQKKNQKQDSVRTCIGKCGAHQSHAFYENRGEYSGKKAGKTKAPEHSILMTHDGKNYLVDHGKGKETAADQKYIQNGRIRIQIHTENKRENRAAKNCATKKDHKKDSKCGKMHQKTVF